MQGTREQVRRLIEDRQIKKAEVMIARLLRAAPGNIELLELRARLHLLAGRPQNALEDISTIEQKVVSIPTPELNQIKADAFLARYEQSTVGFVQKSDLQQAHTIYKQLLHEAPQSIHKAWVLYQIGRLMLIDDDVDLAIKHFKKALAHADAETQPELPALCYERLAFIAHYEQRQPQQALNYLKQAVANYPEAEPQSWLIQVYLMRARILREQDLPMAYAAAEDALRIAGAETSKSRAAIIEVLFTQAEILAEMPGRETELVSVLKRFIQLDKAPVGVDVTWSRVYEMLGNAYMALLEYGQAIPSYEEALRFNPYHPWGETLQYRIAVCQYQLGMFTETIAHLREILQKGVETEAYRMYALLGNAEFAMGLFSNAHASYEHALKVAPAGIDTSTVQAYYDASSRLIVPL